MRAARRPRSSGCPENRGSGGRARWRSASFGLLLGQVEVAVLLLERQRGPILTVRARQLLSDFYAIAKPRCRTSQLQLRVHVELAGDVHSGEEHVAELLR